MCIRDRDICSVAYCIDLNLFSLKVFIYKDWVILCDSCLLYTSCLGIAKTFDEALYKAFIGAGIKLPKHKNMIMTVRDEDHADAVEIGRRFEKIGYHIFATSGTARALNEAGVKATPVRKIEQESPNLSLIHI